jgi:hypothetical protein
MGRNKSECCKVKAGDVRCKDRHGENITIGSIVEIVPLPSDRYCGLYYVHAFEVGERGLRALVARTRYEKWDFKVSMARVVLRCYAPIVIKGE